MSEKLKLEWGDRILSLPTDKLLAALPKASENALKVLIYTASEDSLRGDFSALKNELREKLDCSAKTLNDAFDFWFEAGVLSLGEDTDSTEATRENAEDNKKSTKTQNKKHLQSATLPRYSESDLGDLIEASGDLSGIIDICQQIIGKVFTPADVSVIVGMYDNLGLDYQYITTLVKHCVDKGHKAMRYIEKAALAYFDDNVTTCEALCARLKSEEDYADNLSKVRQIVGADNRELTSREQKIFQTWLKDWRFDFEVIKRAWEVTVDNIGEPSINYINKVLENWFKDNLLTIAAVDAYLDSYKQKKAESANMQASTNQSSGFKTDEIMEAILRRSYKSDNK